MNFLDIFTGKGEDVSFDIILWDLLLKAVYCVLIFLAGKLLIKIGIKIIDRIMNRENGKDNKRRNTLMLLLESVLRYTVYFFVIVTCLSIFGVPVASLIAGAGILGLALGFGAQKLVEDVINGFFILFEDQYGVGDFVDIAGKTGTVQEFGLRTTTIRNGAGQVYIIPNGEIRDVTNYTSVSDMRVMVDVGISYDEKPAEAINKLEKLCQMIAGEKVDILTDGPKVLGVQELADSSVVLRVMARVKPMEHWGMERYIKQRIKEYFDDEGIEIAYPHLVLVTKPESDTQ